MASEEKQRCLSSFKAKLKQTSLNRASFNQDSSHMSKVLTILKSFMEIGIQSKTDLATTVYRGVKRHGTTEFSWVLTHKLLSELLKVSLLKGIAEDEIGNELKYHLRRKSHRQTLYYPTITGILFTFCADKKSYAVYRNNKETFRGPNFSTDEERKVITSLLDSVWIMQGHHDEMGQELRKLLMEKIVENDSFEEAVIAMVHSVLYFILDVTAKDISLSVMSENQEKILKSLSTMVTLRTALRGIKSPELRKIFYNKLGLQSVVYEQMVDYTNFLADEFGQPDEETRKMLSSYRKAIEQTMLRLKTIADLNSLSPLDIAEADSVDGAFSKFFGKTENR